MISLFGTRFAFKSKSENKIFNLLMQEKGPYATLYVADDPPQALCR